MYLKIKVSHLIIGLVLLGSLLWGGVALAGEPDSPGEPSATSSYSLEDLYQRLTAGTVGTSSIFTEPTTAPGAGTMHSINEIMVVAPALDNSTGADAAAVLSGQTFWGLTAGQWATQSGTMANNGAGSTIVPTTTDQSLAAGYWSTANTVQGDADLVASKIASGTTLFGVAGSVEGASGNATDGQVLAGQTYSNDSGPSTGTMADNGAVMVTPATVSQTIALGYHNGSGYVVGDTDLISGNIKSGVNLFGVDGTLTSGSTYNAGVPKTGQTLCYTTANGYSEACPEDSGTYPGQDGDYQKGVAWPVPRFITSTTGIVTDTLTGLIWLQDANCIANKYSGFDADGRVTWTQALTFVYGINAGTYPNCGAGFTDWRLPNVRELQSLVHYGYYLPAVPDTLGTGQWSEGDPFTGVQSANYWSSSTNVNDTSVAWGVVMYNGSVNYDNRAFYANYVWPVRGGQ